MIEYLLKLGYVLEEKINVWSKPSYVGIDYSDGDETELRIGNIIDQASDVTVLSPELRLYCTDWPTLYHLSGSRANILRPIESLLQGDILEIGAGCGAITRYLGECGANVLALEGSLRRATIARSRTRNLENVTVLAERFDEFQCDCQFDVITLIGVLEYANLFTSGETPAQSMLERARSLLKPNGKLIIAIENQLGLKYFAGAPEDHLGQSMYGIEGRYCSNEPQTFGRKVLSGILREAGFVGVEFLAAFPDYKLPVSIITEEGLTTEHFDAGAFAWQSARRDPQLPLYCTFSLELAWPEVFKNEMAMDLANSFLVIASFHACTHIDGGVLAFHYSADRAPRYCKETRFELSDPDTIEVKYRTLGVSGDAETNDRDAIITFNCPASAIYSKGTPLSWGFVQIVTRDGWTIEEVGQYLRRYSEIVITMANRQGIDISVIGSDTSLPGLYFDFIPQNIIVRPDGTTEIIDREWHLTTDIRVGHLLFRALLLMLASITRFGMNASGQIFSRIEFIMASMEAAGFPISEQDCARFVESESIVQEQVTGLPSRNFLSWGPEVPLPLNNLSRAVCDRDGQIAKLNQAVAVRDGEIANLKEAVVYRDGQIGSLNQALADRDERITSLVKQVIVEGEANIAILKQELAERDGLIESKSRIVSDLSRQLDHLSEMVAKRDGQIAKLRGAITDREAAINELKASTSWRVTRPLRTFKGLLLRKGNIADREEEISPQSSNQQTGGGPRAGHAAGILLDHQHRYHLADHPTGYTYIPPRRPDDFERIFKAMERRPTFSIVVPVYNTPSELLLKAIGSVTSQWYPHWELILADDASPSERTKEDLARIDDQRIVVLSLPTNQGIAGATNAALARATGEYVVLLDHDDELTEDCLFELALCINRDRPDYIYSDEDKISPDGLYTEPHFKPDWSPDTMMSTMFVCHVSCIRRSLLIEIGGLRSDYDGCQDWDMVLRLAEKTDRITHIPKVLYHWRIIPASTAADIAAKPYVLDASRRVREDALKRRGLAGTVEPLEQLKGYFRVNYHPRGEPLISIIIPSRDNGEVLSRCLDSIVESSSYRNFELIVLDNGSIEPTTLAYLDRISSQAQTAVIRHDAPFNFSELNNIGFNASRGDLLLFLNDDTEVISADWLERMAGFAQLTHIGAVGAKLLYPGGREVQHAGVVNLEDGPNHAFIRQDADNPCYFVRNLLEYNWLAVTGACLMVERAKFQSVGGFDETFPIAYNDVDLCFRLRDAGYFNVVCQSVRLIHHESVSRGLDHLSTQKIARLEREKRHLFEVHPHYFQRDPFHNPNLHPSGLNFEIAG